MNMLIYHRPCTTSVITVANLPSVFAKTNQCELFSSPVFFLSFLRIRLSPSWTVVCFVSAGRQWWDDNHVQHNPPGLPGGEWAETHLWGFQQGNTLLQDPDLQTYCVLWVSLSVVYWICCIFSRKSLHKKISKENEILIWYLFFLSYQKHIHHGSGRVNCNYNSECQETQKASTALDKYNPWHIMSDYFQAGFVIFVFEEMFSQILNY